MGKKIFAALIVAVVAILAGYNIYQSQRMENDMSDLMLANVEALATSEKGCISKTDKNNGDCTTDSKVYFCENSIIFHDCVKGEYPQ